MGNNLILFISLQDISPVYKIVFALLSVVPSGLLKVQSCNQRGTLGNIFERETWLESFQLISIKYYREINIMTRMAGFYMGLKRKHVQGLLE